MEGNKKTITYYKSKIIDTFTLSLRSLSSLRSQSVLDKFAKYIYNFDYAVMGSRLFYFERV